MSKCSKCSARPLCKGMHAGVCVLSNSDSTEGPYLAEDIEELCIDPEGVIHATHTPEAAPMACQSGYQKFAKQRRERE